MESRPAERPRRSPSSEAPSGAPEAPRPGVGRRRRVVLLVSDEPVRWHALTRLLGAGGLECAVTDWTGATLSVDAFRPRALLVDLDLGDSGRLEQFRRLRADGSRANVPTIALSSSVDARAVLAAHRHGVTDILPRSTEPPLVQYRLVHVLRVHEVLRSARVSESRRRAIAEALPDAMLRVDPRGAIREVLAIGRDGLGLALGSLGEGRMLDDVLPVPRDCSFTELCATALGRARAAERTLRRTDGEREQVLDCRLVPLGDGDCLVVLRDISHRGEDTGTRRALHYDGLTGLPNRAHFMTGVEAALAQHPASSSIAVMRVQVDQFRRIEQSLGPAAADELLAEIGRRLIDLTEGADRRVVSGGGRVASAARLHQDAFALLLSELPAGAGCESVAEALRVELARPAVINGRELRCSVSIGVSVWPENGTDPETLLRNAALAVNHARADGTARLYTDTMRMRSLRSLDIEQHLRRALETGELSLQYQPKVDVVKRRLLGFEALLRWDSPALGRVSPAEVVPVAEQSGLIQALGAWVMQRACVDAQRFSDRGERLPVAVNVSVGQFAGGDLVATARQAVHATGTDPALVELELTESVLMQDIGSALRIVNELREAGFRLSIDDFGTGYSSLQYLRRLPVSALKIDRSFVKDIADDRTANAICSAVVNLGHSLGLDVVAEGVETIEQVSALRARGCSRLQGYLIGRPMPAASVPAWIARGEWQRAIDRSEMPLRTDY